MSWPTDDAILAVALPLINGFEGWSAVPYRDVANVATIGFGSTCYPNGVPVTMQDATISEEQGEAYLRHDVSVALAMLKKALKREPSVNQAAALLSFVYNLGVYALTNSTLLVDFNKGEIEQAGEQFLRWNKSHINNRLVPVEGLTKRRTRERELFLTP